MSAKLGRSRPICVRSWPDSTDFGPCSASLGQHSASCWPKLVDVGQLWPTSTSFGPKSTKCGPNSTNFDGSRSNLGPYGPASTICWQEFYHIRPNCDQNWGGRGRIIGADGLLDNIVYTSVVVTNVRVVCNGTGVSACPMGTGRRRRVAPSQQTEAACSLRPRARSRRWNYHQSACLLSVVLPQSPHGTRHTAHHPRSASDIRARRCRRCPARTPLDPRHSPGAMVSRLGLHSTESWAQFVAGQSVRFDLKDTSVGKRREGGGGHIRG